MLKRDRKKGFSLIELIVALSIFIILAIPITNSIIQNIKANKLADMKKDEVMAMNYGYENLRDLVEKSSLSLVEGTHDIEIDNEPLKYQGRFVKYVYKYTVESVDTFTTNAGTTAPIKGTGNNNDDQSSNSEFESKIIIVSLKLYEKLDGEESDKLLKSEEYTFRNKG